MAQYANLIATITAAIRTNGVGAITGQLLQTILHGMVNSLGLNYQYAGIATPSTNPGAPDQRVLYLATQAGTYEHFGGAVLDGVTVHIFTYDGTWHDATLAVATKAELAAYLQIADLASGTGQSTTTTMTQKAITDALLGLAEDIETAVEELTQALKSHVSKLPELVVGSSAGVLGRTVDASFLFRRTAGTAKIGRGAAALNAIYGRTLAWNQLVQNGNFADGTTGWRGITSVVDGVATKTVPATGTTRFGNISQTIQYQNGHTYIFVIMVKSNNSSTKVRIVPTGLDAEGADVATVYSGWTIATFVWVRSGSGTEFTISGHNEANPNVDVDFSVKNVMCFDLTQMWGTGDEPTAGAFRALYNKAYFPATPGSLISNDAAALETVGFNQWDEVWEKGAFNSNTGEAVENSDWSRSKNYIPIFPSTDYYASIEGIDSTYYAYVFYYDANYNFISHSGMFAASSVLSSPVGAMYARIQYKRTIGTVRAYTCCYNLHDPAKNGTYEPYWKRVVTLNLSTMTGKLNGAGASIIVFPSGLQSAGSGANMVQDSTDGISATKRVGTRAYQTGDENDSTLTTDGTNTNYPLTAAETYVLDEPLQMSYQVENDGTEQAVAPDGATLPSAPFMAHIQYPLDVIAMQGDSLADMLEAMVAAGVITAYTMTYNIAAQKYEFTINGVSRNLPENNRKGGGNDEPNGDDPGSEPGEEQTDPGSEDPIDENPGGDIQEKQDSDAVRKK